MDEIISLFRNLILKELTGNLGEVKVTEDEIVCYVDNKQLQKKYNIKDSIYKVDFCNVKRIKTEILEKYDINKPVRYIVKEIRFKDKLFFRADKDTIVSFEKCKFHNQICITGADKVIFENNKYFDRQPIYTYKKFLVGSANTIVFKFDNFANCVNVHPNKLGMELFVNELNVINSKIALEEAHQDLFAMANYINIINSQISCPSAYLICDNINVIGSKITTKKIITIDEKNNNNYGKLTYSIESPSVIYNGVEQQRISNSDIAKAYHRLELIKVLRKIKEQSVVEINKKLDVEKTKLHKIPIGKIKR